MAGRRCTICHDERRKAIDAAILDGQSERVVAHLFGLERTAIQRHKSRHIAPKVRQVIAAQERKSEGQIKTWLEEIAAAKQSAIENLEWAKREGDAPDANGAVAQVLRSLELIGKASGELSKAEAKGWWQEYGSKDQIERILDAARQSHDIGEPDLFERWIETGMMLIRAQPQRRVEVLQRLSGGLITQEVENGVGTRRLGNGVGGNGVSAVADGGEPKLAAGNGTVAGEKRPRQGHE